MAQSQPKAARVHSGILVPIQGGTLMPYYRDTHSEHQDLCDLDIVNTPAAMCNGRSPVAPVVALAPGLGLAHTYNAPGGDQQEWEVRICHCFGTRRLSIARTFLDQLTSLCTVSYDVKNGRWKPSEIELNFAISLIDSIRPRNQMESSLAAQMVAVHFMQMRMSARVLGEQDIEARDVAAREASIAGKLARTFAIQMETLARMRGRRTSRQSIKVRKDNHVHYHVHGGARDSGAEPRAARAVIEPARIATQSSPLPGQDEAGTVVPLSSRQRKAGL